MARSYLPPGFRFHPTDEELLVHYLKKKVAGRRMNDGVIGEIEIYKFEPTDLPGLATLLSRDPEWFFFNAQDKKYLHGARTNRTTRAGYWKATGKDRKISAGSCTGLKKTLIYYCGRAPHGERTDWVMHEYRLDEEFEKKMNCTQSFVLCRIRRKGGLGPRNGEQYGAPVLEPSEENEGGLSTSYPPEASYPLEEPCVLPPVDTEIVQGQVLETPHFPIDEGFARTERVGAGDYIDSFLQTLISFEEQEQQPVHDEVLSFDDLLGLADNLGDFTVMEPGPTNFMDLGFGDLDNFCGLMHPADNESALLEEMLHLASGQVEIPDGFNGRRALEEPSHSQASDDVHNVGFIELADLEEPCDEEGTLECADIEELLYELDNGVEIPMSTRLAHESLQVQSLQSFGDRQSSRGLQYLEGSGMVNEQLALEVPLDSSQGLNVLDSIDTRLLTSDEGGGFSDDLPSGFLLNSHEEGDFSGNSTSSMAHSHSHSSRVDEPPEAQLVRVDNLPGVNLDTQGGGHSVASVSQEETRVAHGEDVSINGNTTPVQALEQPNSTAGLLNNNAQLNSSVGSLAPSHTSPSSFARVISGFLGKVNVLPASAAELPVELERCKPLLNDSSKYFTAEGEISQSAPTPPSSLSISSAPLHFSLKLIDLEHIARTPEMEPCKSFTNAFSIFLFRMTTLAAILFCIFRGFCRSTRSDFLLMFGDCWHFLNAQHARML